MTSKTILERFMDKVELIPFHTCWEWTAGLFSNGYPQFWLNGTNRMGNRVSYELFIGPIPGGLVICHSCDNPTCVNPAHLWAGTMADNHKDRNNKGRQATGEKHGSSKLSLAQVIQIRTRLRNGERGCNLCKEFGVRDAVISKIGKRQIWKQKEAEV